MNMVGYKINESLLIIEMKGWDKLWSLKGSLKIDLKKIVRVRHVANNDSPPWLRSPGTSLPGVITAGTYYGKGKKEFWCTRYKNNAVVIDLADADYTRVVVDVEDDIDGLIKSISSKIS